MMELIEMAGPSRRGNIPQPRSARAFVAVAVIPNIAKLAENIHFISLLVEPNNPVTTSQLAGLDAQL
jgi:hypothetical protein